MLRNVSPVSRKLFWRYKSHLQQASRDGNMKYLKIDNETFLFNVVDDPLERANLKGRQPEVYQRLVSDYNAWNATMLPLDSLTTSHHFTSSQLADHYGNPD